MQQQNVEPVGVHFSEEAFDVPPDVSGRPGRGLGGDHHRVARYAAQRFGDVGVRAVLIGRVPERHAVIVSQPQQLGQSIQSQGCLFGSMSPAVRARSHRQAGYLQPGLAKINIIHKDTLPFRGSLFLFAPLYRGPQRSHRTTSNGATIRAGKKLATLIRFISSSSRPMPSKMTPPAAVNSVTMASVRMF